jgi:hypothetical protein
VSAYLKLFRRLREKMLTQDEWYKIICQSYLNPPVFLNGIELPGFPPDEIQTNTTGQAGVNTLKKAFVFYQDCILNFDKLGFPLKHEHFLLDFGVGWGRIARFFLRELPIENIYGIDVMEKFIEICKTTFRSDNFDVTAAIPPSKLPDKKFNFIVGYSVFSHLSEKACAMWMQEFNRILVKDGIVALTTRGRPFFNYCESLRGKNLSGYSLALSNMFDDFDEARDRYDRGEFIHSNCIGLTGGGAMNADFYGESFIPEQYAKSAYADIFTLKKYVFDPKRQTHPIMFFKKY